MSPTPYYQDDWCTIYHGDAGELVASLEFSVVLTDPPYPNGAGHFDDGIPTARTVLAGCSQAVRLFVFWHQLEVPPSPLGLVAKHIWHKTNTNRPDNYEPIYEFAAGPERYSKVFPHAVIAVGLTGCKEATEHPTQKPIKLMHQLVTLRGDEGVILDPFMGSGSTVRAAKDVGHKSIGIELNERYCEIAAKRLAQEVLDFGGAA